MSPTPFALLAMQLDLRFNVLDASCMQACRQQLSSLIKSLNDLCNFFLHLG